MARLKLALLLLSAGAAAAPASAGVTVIGNGAARQCYELAEAGGSPQRSALDTCDRALTQEALSAKDTVATHVNRGILRSLRGDVQGALADFDQASALDPNEPEAYLNKALVLTMKVKQAKEALPLFTMALEKNTRRPELAFFGRGAANEDLGNVQSAYSDYSNAAAAAPKWAAPRTELTRFNVRRP